MLHNLNIEMLIDIFEVKKFSMCIGGFRPKFKGQDASLWHYLLDLRANIVWVFHMDYSKTTFVCRATQM